MDGVRFLLPYLSDKRRVTLGRALVEELLEKRLAALADCPEHMQQMETGSMVGICQVTGSPLVLWRGKTHVRCSCKELV
jgi:LSD1 subclass zinc finger protein